MLRAAVQLVGALLMVAGVWLLAVGAPAGIQALLVGVILLVAVRYERWRDRARPDVPDTHWRATGERFHFRRENGDGRERREWIVDGRNPDIGAPGPGRVVAGGCR